MCPGGCQQLPSSQCCWAAKYSFSLSTCSRTDRLEAPPSVSRISAERLKSHT